MHNSSSLPKRPLIDASMTSLSYHKDAAWTAVRHANDQDPFVFTYGGALVRVAPGEGGPRILRLTEHGFRNLLEEVSDWRRPSSGADDQETRPTYPPLEVARAMLADVTPPVPTLHRVVSHPVFSPDGTLVMESGFHPAQGMWCHPTCTVPAISLSPTRVEVDAARAFLLEEMLGDFPFADDASKAHALAALILPFVRPMIGGPTPLHIVDARSGQGTGKSLLCETLASPAGGQQAVIAPCGSEEEWRKRLTAVLEAAPTFIVIDNVQRPLDSPALAALLTAPTWQDRILGQSKTVKLPVLSGMMANGNAIRTSREIARRSVLIFLDAATESPWLRDGFRHTDIRRWCAEHRGDLAAAALTLAAAWVAQGKPPGSERLGSFESWAAVMGGILEVAGVPGFLANRDTANAELDDETKDLADFVRAWWERHGGDEVTAAKLHRLAMDLDLLPNLMLQGRGENSQRIVVGMFLKRLIGRHVLGKLITAGRGDRKVGVAGYRLVEKG